MRRELLLLCLAAGLSATGCIRQKVDDQSQAALFDARSSTPSRAKSSRKAPLPSNQMIVTPATGNHGKISAVNPTARYVVVSYLTGVPLPVLDQRLNVYRNGLKVGEIKITGPSRDTLTVGDIVAGECRSGDEVRED